MNVIKRNNEIEEVSFDKVLNRIKILSKDLNVNYIDIAQKVISRIYDNVKTSELDELAANICSSMICEHPDYSALAARISISNHHKNTSPSFSETVSLLYNNDFPLVSKQLYETVMKNKEKLNNYIVYQRDYLFDYFGYKTLERSYLLKINGKIVERPQHLIMRVALGIHGNDIKDALQTYDHMSKKYFTHASPTLFNAGTPRPQLSSCFVKGTNVYTSKGIKPIEEIEIGDKVLTLSGKFYNVSQIHINSLNNRKLFDFKAYVTPEITATENHSFMSLTSEQIEWGQDAQWNTLEHLRVGDYIQIPDAQIEDNSDPIIDLSTMLNYDKNKNLDESFHQLSTKKIKEFLYELFKLNNFVINESKYDRLFIQNLYNLAKSRGIIVSYDDFELTIPKESDIYMNTLEFKGKKYVRIMSKKYSLRNDDTVYNIGVENDHSYVVEGLIAKNCFLLSVNGDSVEQIYDTFKECALISRYAGGIGLHVHDIRAKGSIIRGTNGISDGIVPMLKVLNQTARYINQCFTPETIVYTSKGPKEIQNINPDDQVITLDGTFKPVNTVIKNEIEKDILEFTSQYGYQNVKCTKEHEVYVWKKNEIQPKFIPANEINIDDLVGYPIPNHICDYDYYDNDFFRIYGIMVSNGVIDIINNNLMKINLLYNSSLDDTVLFIKSYIDNCSISNNINFNGSLMMIEWINDFDKFPLKYEHLYDKNNNKIINPDWHHLPIDKTKSLINGILEYHSISLNNNSRFNYYYSGDKNIEYSLRYILIRLNILSGKSSNNYLVLFQNDKKIIQNNIIWSRIENIKTIPYKGFVYDLNIQDNHNYTTDLGLVHNSGKRNGSVAVYIEPWHADIFEFLDLKKPHGSEEDRARDLFYALWIPDLFMERVKNNQKWSLMCPDKCKGLADVYGNEFKELYEKYESEGLYNKQVDAQLLWFKILEIQIESGTPYLLFKDACNKKSNQKNLGTIKSSNLCVAPETMILTDKGYYPIIDLVEQEVNVWNGKEFSNTIIKQTGKNQKLLTVKFSNGMEIRCTQYHKFYIEVGKRPFDKSVVKIIEAKDLKLNMKIIRYELPTINIKSELVMKYPYTHGLFCADGTYEKHDEYLQHQCNYQRWNNTSFCKKHQDFELLFDNNNNQCCAQSFCNKPKLWLYGEKKKLIEYLEWTYFNEDNSQDRLNLALPHDIDEKYLVPINYDIKTKIRWLEGYFDGDGCIVSNNGVKNIQVSSSNKEFLINVFYLLQTIGINAPISLLRDKRMTLMPDGRGGSKEYLCQNVYRLNISCSSVLHLISLGYSPKRLNIENIRAPNHITNKYIQITGIEDKEEYSDTYCFNEKTEHAGIFNGILTKNCSEIIEYSSPEETAVCNLANLALPTYIEYDENSNPYFNYNKLHEVTKIITKNLNKIIDINFYPVEKCRRSNLKHRPLAIGIQGLADVFVLMRLPFESDEAKHLNKLIFETIYHAAIEQSMVIAKTRYETINNSDLTDEQKTIYLNSNEFDPSIDSKYPGAYSSFENSPASQGKLQFDLWDNFEKVSDRYDWNSLKEDIKKYGLRNSLLTSVMPTASTSNIMGFNEACEAFTSNIYKRKTLSGEFIIINKYLVKDLIKMNLWNTEMKNKIILNNGSVQDIDDIPDNIKKLYKTVWEIKQRHCLDQAAQRGPYICQSQSTNLFIEDPNNKILSSMYFYAYMLGLKTGVYYLRTKPKGQSQKFTIEPEFKKKEENKKKFICTDEVCTSCQ